MASTLSSETRATSLRALAETTAAQPLDVLVVGGGVTGAGIVLDAATRGLSCGLVEQRDLASGTSSRSSKLVHGGLRYLEMFDFALVKEALQERGLLLTRLAPHLVHPVPFLYPLHKAVERPYVGAGLVLYDAMASLGKYDMGVPRHRHLFRKQLARIAPDLDTEKLSGAIRYYDCQVDDARLVMTLARTAADNGAHIATRTRVVDFLREGDKVVGVRAVDLEADPDVEFEIRARVVINAAGVWTDEIQQMADAGQLHVRASKGIHLVVPRDRIRSEAGFITKTEKSVLFVIPWDRHWIIGTTDTPWDLDKAHPAASRADIDYVLGHLNALLKEPLDHDDITGVYAGLRPLLSGESEPTSKISREHTVSVPAPGLVMIAGGKLTTYRVMAKDAIDAVVDHLDDFTQAPVRDCITDRVPLIGAARFQARTNQRVVLSRRHGLPLATIDHLLGRYGGLVDEVLALLDERPELAEPLAEAPDYLAVEVVYAVTHEGALHLDDVLARRTRISIETFDRGTRVAQQAASLMAGPLGWDDARVADEVDHWLRRVEAERQSQQMATDQEADEARVQAPEIV